MKILDIHLINVKYVKNIPKEFNNNTILIFLRLIFYKKLIVMIWMFIVILILMILIVIVIVIVINFLIQKIQLMDLLNLLI